MRLCAVLLFAILISLSPYALSQSKAPASDLIQFDQLPSDVSPPTVLSKAEPEYSNEARAARLEGTVKVSVLVDEQGHQQNVKVMSSLGLGLDEKAVEAVEKWRFNPGTKDGKPVPVSATIAVNFQLTEPPRVLNKAEPGYTNEARSAGLEGTAILSLLVDEQGHPQHLKVMRPLGMGLDQKALEAVQKWRFKPGMKGGKPIPVMATVEVNFKLAADLSPQQLRLKADGGDAGAA